MPRKERDKKSTPLSKKITMAASAVFILLVFFYFFGDVLFPMDISYENLR